jgi:hypothetical protein
MSNRNYVRLVSYYNALASLSTLDDESSLEVQRHLAEVTSTRSTCLYIPKYRSQWYIHSSMFLPGRGDANRFSYRYTVGSQWYQHT